MGKVAEGTRRRAEPGDESDRSPDRERVLADTVNCVGGICKGPDGRVEIHLDGGDPKCREMAELLTELVSKPGGVRSTFVLDPPKEAPQDERRGPSRPRKG